MRKIKTVLMGLMLLGLATGVWTPIMAEGAELCERINAVRDQAAFFVAYGKETGAPIAVIEAPGFTVLAEGGPTREEKEKGQPASISLEKLIPLLQKISEQEKVVDTIDSPTIFVHGSPGCYIKTSTGGWKFICPR